MEDNPKPLIAVVLAAGEGTRMKSDLPKVLHPICSRPMVEYVLEAAKAVKPSRTILVIGYQGELVKAVLGESVEFVNQPEQLGTAHAVLQTEQVLGNFAGDLLILSGDTPLLRGETLLQLVRYHRDTGAALTVLTALMNNPTGYGRIIRDEQGRVRRIIEERDATEGERKGQEINTGTYVFDAYHLFRALKLVQPDNRQREYYLTDVLGIFYGWELPIATLMATDPLETMGINTREQLQEAEAIMKQRLLTA